MLLRENTIKKINIYRQINEANDNKQTLEENI